MSLGPNSPPGPPDKNREAWLGGWWHFDLGRPRAENASEPQCVPDPWQPWDNKWMCCFKLMVICYGSTTKLLQRLGPSRGGSQPAPSLFSLFLVHLSPLPICPSKRLCSPHSIELLLFHYECVQSHTQPNYCFWLTPTHNVVCHAVLLLISQMNTFLFF